MTLTHPLGIVLPQSVLESTTFQIFAGFVALNTLIYVGLTLSKLVVWPEQVHMRRLVARFVPGRGGRGGGTPNGREATVAEPSPVNLRSALTGHDIPFALAWIGVLVVGLNVAFIFVGSGHELFARTVGAGLGVAMLAAAQVLARATAGERAASWTWVASGVVIAIYLASPLVDTYQYLVVPLLLLVLASSSYVLSSWTPFIVSSALTFGATAVAIWRIAPPEPIAWVLIAVGAVVIGAVTLRTRLRAIQTLDEANRLSQALATTDVLTGHLTRSGIESLFPRMLATARRAEEPLCVMHISIPDFDRAIADYDRAYADRVVEAVGTAVRATVREGDLVARWTDESFLVVGFGSEPATSMLRKRIQSMVRESGVDLGKWPIRIAAGAASGDAAESDLLRRLIERAALTSAVHDAPSVSSAR